MKEKPNLKPRSLTRISAISADQLRRTFDPKDQPVPEDWLYVNNFEDSDKPRALRLPAGIGCQFQKDMERLVENLETEVPNALAGIVLAPLVEGEVLAPEKYDQLDAHPGVDPGRNNPDRY